MDGLALHRLAELLVDLLQLIGGERRGVRAAGVVGQRLQRVTVRRYGDLGAIGPRDHTAVRAEGDGVDRDARSLSRLCGLVVRTTLGGLAVREQHDRSGELVVRIPSGSSGARSRAMTGVREVGPVGSV